MTRALFALVLMFVMSSCGVGNNLTSQPTAYVSHHQAVRAFSKIAAIDYLPFGYKWDGCYARSLFMAMELAVDGIPSSAQFAVGDLRPTNEISWRYHVVPMLIVGNDSEPTVIDPSLLSGPTSRSKWLQAMNAQGVTDLVAVPGSYYDPYSTPSKSQERIIRSMSEMPPFDLDDVNRACRLLHAYLDNEGAENRAEKQAKLSRQAESLANGLAKIGKLAGELNSPSGSVDCSGSPFN